MLECFAVMTAISCQVGSSRRRFTQGLLYEVCLGIIFRGRCVSRTRGNLGTCPGEMGY